MGARQLFLRLRRRLTTVSEKQPQKDHPTHFDDIVANAISFLDRAVEELIPGTRCDRLKFAAVFFYQAVELFVKARLLCEHWSLVLDDPKKADRNKFENGDFRSVGLNEATLRLQRIAGEDVSEAHKAFEPIHKRRNRIVHFHAADVPDLAISQVSQSNEVGADLFENAPPELESLVREQCVAWFELHTLLTQRWRRYFDNAQASRIEWLDRRMRELRPYLKARFDNLRPKIEGVEAAGTRITDCAACGYRANEDVELYPGMMLSKCLVCGRSKPMFRFPCPVEECDGEVAVTADCEGGACSECEEQMSVEDIVSHFMPTYRRQKDYLNDNFDTAYCSSCESSGLGVHTVVRVEDADRYICFACLEDFEHISQCEWCSENVTGDTDDSFWLGCLMCDGHAGHHRDRD